MPRKPHIIRQHTIIAYDAIMGHMRAGHKQIMVAYMSRPPAFYGAGIDGHIFTENIIGADIQKNFICLPIDVQNNVVCSSLFQNTSL